MIPNLIDSTTARSPVNQTQRATQGDFSRELSSKEGENRLKEEGRTTHRGSANERDSSALEAGSPGRGESTRSQRGSVEVAAHAIDTSQDCAAGAFQELNAQLLTESRIFGLHLGASPYLSIRAYGSGGNDSPMPHASSCALDTTSKGEAMVEDSGGWKQGGLAALAPAATADRPGALVLPESEPIGLNEDSMPLSPSLRMETAWLAPNHWAPRSVRLARDKDGRSLVWMRDFQISAADAAQLATQLTQLLADQGVKVHGVMWNGQEIWSSEHNSNGTML